MTSIYRTDIGNRSIECTPFYHEVEFWRKAPNASGCVRAKKIFGSTATTLDEAAKERAEIASGYHRNTLISACTLGGKVVS
jgi:hypothetical protein